MLQSKKITEIFLKRWDTEEQGGTYGKEYNHEGYCKGASG